MLCYSRLAFLVTLATCSLPGFAVQAQQPVTPTTVEAPKAEPAKTAPVDPIERIKDEALNKSQVMETLSYLTDVIGPRLTASPDMKRANEWTRDKLASWGLENAHLEKWGPFGKGWTLKKFSIQVVEPQCIPLIAFPKAWSPGHRRHGRRRGRRPRRREDRGRPREAQGQAQGRLRDARPAQRRSRPTSSRWAPG